MIRVYLDNCCFNRPFDDQSSIRVKLETDAKLYVQSMVRATKLELAWSYILDFENEANPFIERKVAIEKWKNLAVNDISESSSILERAFDMVNFGLKPKDALHIACAKEAGCHYFLTTDDIILKRMTDKKGILVLNPIDFIKLIEKL